MEVIIEGQIDFAAFDRSVRTATRDLSEVLMAAIDTESARIESTHFLMALAKIPNGVTQKGLERLGMSPQDLRSGLVDWANRAPGEAPVAQLTAASLDDSALRTLRRAGELCDKGHARITEAMLLLAALENLTPKVTNGLVDAAGFDVDGWRAELAREISPPAAPEIFAAGEPEGRVDLAAFSRTGRKILGLMKGEAEALGFEMLDLRHLLLALLAFEPSALNVGLHHQGLAPRKLQAALMLHLRARAKRVRSSLSLDKQHLQPLLVRVIETAARYAAQDRIQRVAERHLSRAFLASKSAAQSFLSDEGVSLERLRASVDAPWEAGEEELGDDDPEAADVETVRRRLRARLVGQDDAIERILPYIQRMRFGFTVPERPVGVFLFCGASGTGKTEMAKELARAVYGSEENLIFLEMGHFNSPESMNIFVGAPPGYIGYGEGKLTNGLRDKPKAVVLFDEIEKAHTKVLDALLRFLDEGRIDDPAGPVRDGSQCIAILTSNVGVDAAAGSTEGGASAAATIPTADALHVRLRQAFLAKNVRPEFLNRVDELILFNTFTPEHFREITRRVRDRLCGRLKKERGVEVEVKDDLIDAIGDECVRVNQGARTAMRLVMSHVITPVIDFSVRNEPPSPVRLVVAHTPGDDEPLRVKVALQETPSS